MQLLSIENLGLAAEATIALLLLAIAWPQKPVQSAPKESETVNWEPAKYYFSQSCIHRGLYLHHWRAMQSRDDSKPNLSGPFLPKSIVDDESRPVLPVPWQDRLTKLLNRHGFDAILNAWLAVEPKHRGESCLSMITLDQYSELVRSQGAMVMEKALQRVAAELTKTSSGDILISRYLPDKFVLLHFASGLAICHEAMKGLRQSISTDGFFCVADQPVSLTSNVSIIELSEYSDGQACIDELEEGAEEADSSGHNTISKVGGKWTDSPTINDVKTHRHVLIDEPSDKLAVAPTTAPSVSAADDPSSQVASAEDIERLLAAAKS